VFCEAGSEKVVECSADGLTQTVKQDCASAGQVCVAGACAPVICPAAQRFCQGSELRQCTAKGDASSLVQTCTATQFCDETNPACRTQICTPNQPACDGNTATTCNANGSGYRAGGTQCSPQFCVTGACRAALFVEDFEDGDFTGWTSGAGTYTRQVSTTTAANGTTRSLSLYKSGTTASNDGLYRTFSALQPGSISFWIYPYYYPYTVFYSSDTTAAPLVTFYFSSTTLYMSAVTSTSAAVTPNTWHRVELRNINWTARTFDYWLDGTQRTTGTAFLGSGTSILRMDMYDYYAGYTNYWDEIFFL
jgi:hypothetical protein